MARRLALDLVHHAECSFAELLEDAEVVVPVRDDGRHVDGLETAWVVREFGVRIRSGDGLRIRPNLVNPIAIIK